MAYPIKRVRIEGFRGILALLELGFTRDSNPCSMIVFGENGHGKSSITDAWEWFSTGQIGHLQLEGAKHASYFHKGSIVGHSYVEIEFSDQALGTIRLAFDHNRVTQPQVQGNLDAVRALCHHPCQIRFSDLTRFVRMPKSNRFDELAQLMGFVPQVQYQKALRRVEKKIDEHIAGKVEMLASKEEDLKGLLSLGTLDESLMFKELSERIVKAGLSCDSTPEGVRGAASELKKLLAEDTTAQKVSQLRRIQDMLTDTSVADDISGSLETYVQKLEDMLKDKEALADLLFVQLYEAAESILENAADRSLCPLCGSQFDGDLLEHVKQQHQILASLVQKRAAVATAEALVKEKIRRVPDICEKITALKPQFELLGITEQFGDLLAVAKELAVTINESEKQIVSCGLKVDNAAIKAMMVSCKAINGKKKAYDLYRSELGSRISSDILSVEARSNRVLLVDTHDVIKKSTDMWRDILSARGTIKKLNAKYEEFSTIVDDYAKHSANDVKSRFDLISSNVDKYFACLEYNTPGIRSPRLKLLESSDRAVVLEIEFQGDSIQPAYKYLSESQLNSFGLAVFFASVRQFNEQFKFIVLDDIINSFDSYKRQRVIDLLKAEFQDFQILLLTHDALWKDRLYRSMPSWVRVEFYGYAPSSGPLLRTGKLEVDRIKQLIDTGYPIEAARNFGPYLEQQLQIICQSFEVMVKYNQRNEYTMEPLFNFLTARIKKKLGSDHDFVARLSSVWEDSVFRNFCLHWKEDITLYTKEEMQDILARWLEVESRVYCTKEGCCQVLRFDGNNAFVCPCGCSRLEKSADE